MSSPSPTPLSETSKIYVAGHRGLVGSALVRTLESAGFGNIVTRTHKELDLTDARATREFFKAEQPTHVFLAAARVGGIRANDQWPADFIRDNLRIQNNVLDASFHTHVEKLLFLGSSCIYPKHASQPMSEDALLTGPLEPTNAPYAIAKIAGLTMCESYNRQHGTRFIAAMPTNLYGPYDNFDLESAHVVPAMIRRMHEAKARGAPSITLWGTGNPKREMLHVNDMAEGCLFLMQKFEADPNKRATGVFLNVGTGEDCTIRELAEHVRQSVGFNGEINWDTSQPDGTPRKCLNVERIRALGWKPQISLREGLENTYHWYLQHGPNGH